MAGPPALRSERGRSRVLVAVVLCIASALGSVVVGPAPADAARSWSPGFCPGDNGVTVVVDFQELGGGVQVRCAPDSLSSGFDALRSAGFTPDTAVRSPGFLCRIDGKPSVEDDACVVESPTSAYWSYWQAERGGSWTYSNSGAIRKPPQGTVEGWSFSLGRSQSTAPPPRSDTFPPPAQPPATSPPPVVPQQPAAPPVLGPPAAVGAATTLPGPVAGPSDGPAPSTTSPATSTIVAPVSTDGPVSTGPGDSSPDEPTGGSEDEDADSNTDPESTDEESARSSVELADSGRSGPASPVGTGMAVGAMAVLGAGAVLVNRRRFTVAPGAADES